MAQSDTAHGPVDGLLQNPQREKVAFSRPDWVAPPVFIADCVTPIAGETLLSLILKRLAEADERDDQP